MSMGTGGRYSLSKVLHLKRRWRIVKNCYNIICNNSWNPLRHYVELFKTENSIKDITLELNLESWP